MFMAKGCLEDCHLSYTQDFVTVLHNVKLEETVKLFGEMYDQLMIDNFQNAQKPGSEF